VSDPLSLDTLIADILRMYDESRAGVQARVEQEASAIRTQFRRRGVPVTRETTRAYVMSVMFGGMAAGIGPGPSREADKLGNVVAGACLLYRSAKDQP
jgi:hypothetical protein